MGKIYIGTVVERTHANLQTIYSWIRDGKLKGIKEGKRWVFDEGELRRFMDSYHYAGFTNEMGNTSMFRRVPDAEECYPYNLIHSILDSENTDDCFPAIDIWDLDIRKVKAQLVKLTDREQKVIELRYQFGLTLDETGKTINCTRERVRQIQAKAERKLRYFIKTGNCKVVSEEDYEALKVKIAGLETTIANLSLRLENHDFKNTESEPVPVMAKDIKIETLGLSVRAYNCLKRANIDTLQDIIDLDMNQDKYNRFDNHNWLGIRNMGCRTMKEVAKCVLDNCGYQLRKYDPGIKAYIGTFLQE